MRRISQGASAMTARLAGASETPAHIMYHSTDTNSDISSARAASFAVYQSPGCSSSPVRSLWAIETASSNTRSLTTSFSISASSVSSAAIRLRRASNFSRVGIAGSVDTDAPLLRRGHHAVRLKGAVVSIDERGEQPDALIHPLKSFPCAVLHCLQVHEFGCQYSDGFAEVLRRVSLPFHLSCVSPWKILFH